MAEERLRVAANPCPTENERVPANTQQFDNITGPARHDGNVNNSARITAEGTTNAAPFSDTDQPTFRA